MAAKPKTSPERPSDLELGRDHLTGYSGWPPPPHVKEHLEIFAKFIEDNVVDGKILDLGCGDGAIDRLVAERCKNKTITGSDLEVHKQWSVKPPKNLKFVAESIYDLPYKPKSFDAVIIKDVLHHLPDPEKVVAEISKLAKHQVVIIEANRYNPISYIRMVKIAKHEHLSLRRLKKIVNKTHTLHTKETHVWPDSVRPAGKIVDKVFGTALFKRIRNYNIVIFKP